MVAELIGQGKIFFSVENFKKIIKETSTVCLIIHFCSVLKHNFSRCTKTGIFLATANILFKTMYQLALRAAYQKILVRF